MRHLPKQHRTTSASNFGLFKVFDDAGLFYEKTSVGDKYVHACMNQRMSTACEHHRDLAIGGGILTSLRIMSYEQREKPLS